MKSLQGFSKTVLLTAMLPNGGIGLDDKLPWHIPEELKLFKKLTTGCTLVVGSNTFKSLPNLPERCVLRIDGRLPKKYVLCGGGAAYASLYKQGMEMVVSIVRDDGFEVNKFLSQDLQADIRWMIQNRKLQVVFMNTQFSTYATEGVRKYLFDE